MKALVIDEAWGRPSATHVSGGVEKASLCMAEALECPLYTYKTTDGASKIGSVELIESSVPPKIEWTEETSSREMNKQRENEIVGIVRRGEYDLVINNGCSASLINISTAVRKRTGARTIQFGHLSYTSYSFPRFAMAKALWEHHKVGGKNAAVAQDIADQFAIMVEKKRQYISEDIDGANTFSAVIPPLHMDYLQKFEVRDCERSGVFAMTRFAPDKRPDALVKMVQMFRAKDIPCTIHLMPFAGYENELAVAVDHMKSIGAEVSIRVPQHESFDAASTAVCNLFPSQIESFGIVPVEMACLGVPTLFSEHKTFKHALNTTMYNDERGHMYGYSVGDKPNFDALLPPYHACRALLFEQRLRQSDYFKKKYSKAEMRRKILELADTIEHTVDPFA